MNYNQQGKSRNAVNLPRKLLNVVLVALKFRLWQSNVRFVAQNLSDVRRLS
jgi:hypothetical protein